MKKYLAMLLMAVMAISLMSVSLAEEEDYISLHPQCKAFDGVWVNPEVGRIAIDVEDGGVRVSVTRSEEGRKGWLWQYACLYNEQNNTLEDGLFGSKNAITYDEDGSGKFEIGETVYEDGSAVFALDEQGRLIWRDGKEDAGRDARFTKIGRYDDTHWVNGQYSVEICWQDEGYKVFVKRVEGDNKTTEWDYSCYYQADTDTLVGNGFGVKTEITYAADGTMADFKDVYEDGEAEFSMNGEGGLIWKDLKEDAGHGLVFEPDLNVG